MKNYLFILLFICHALLLKAQTDTVNSKISKLAYKHVDAIAKFPQGDFKTYITRSLQINHTVEYSINGQIILLVSIGADGGIARVSVLKSLSPQIDPEVVQVIKASPKWLPATLNGDKVSMDMVLNIDLAVKGINPAPTKPKVIKTAPEPILAMAPPVKVPKPIKKEDLVAIKVPAPVTIKKAGPIIVNKPLPPVVKKVVPPLIKKPETVVAKKIAPPVTKKAAPVIIKKPEPAIVKKTEPPVVKKPARVIAKKVEPPVKKAEPPVVKKPAPVIAKKVEPPVKKPEPPVVKKVEPPVKKPDPPVVKKPVPVIAKKVEPPVKKPEPPIVKKPAPVIAKKVEPPIKKTIPSVVKKPAPVIAKKIEPPAKKPVVAAVAKAPVVAKPVEVPPVKKPKRVLAKMDLFHPSSNGAVFPGGGLPAFFKYLGENIAYPPASKMGNIEGKVFLSFTIEEDGTVDEVEVISSPAEDLSQEAIRVLLASPKWKPASQNGIKVPVSYTIPIKFTLENKTTN